MWRPSDRRRWWLLLALLIAILILDRACSEEVRIATFNIENYPKSTEQAAGAFALIAALKLDVVAVQEIMDPVHFSSTARSKLGPRWRFLHTEGGPDHRVGILYNRDRFRLLSVRELPQTVTYPGAKPALEARLRPREGGAVVRVITLHLKAGGDHFETRKRQLDALQVVLTRAAESSDRVVILGDFNATGDPDRRRIRDLADHLDMEWATEPLACTSYWDREDGCFGSALDHILSSDVPDDVDAMGPCRTEGCDRKDRCPIYREQISDHCPVVLEL
jgi:endonuclease/exonuclease/phosphatase family metal-dependent hydrolase